MLKAQEGAFQVDAAYPIALISGNPVMLANCPSMPVLLTAKSRRPYGVSFILYWPTLMALVSRVAPPRLSSTLMGVVMLTLFVANTTVGVIGGSYERTSSAMFWAGHAAIGAVGGLLVMLFSRRLRIALVARTPLESALHPTAA